MSTLILGGTGFIGRRLVPLLAQRGEEVVCMDLNPGTASYGQLADRVRVVRGDVTQFDDVMAVTVAAKPSRVVNLAYFLGSEHAPHVATKLNIVGMDNCFEAARLCGVNRVVFASSLAVSGEQHFYGDRVVTEDDFRHGHVQYAMHKIFNEWQAQDYREKYGMEITAIRPANVTGPDKIVGSVDQVHVDDIAEVFARVLLTDKPRHAVYNTGGTPISLGDLATLVREFLPDAQISFEHETGGKETSGNYLIDNTRLIQEFGLQYLPYRQRVLQIINDTRREAGLPPVADR